MAASHASESDGADAPSADKYVIMLREFFLQRGSQSRSELFWAWFGLAVVLGQAIFSAYIKFAVNKCVSSDLTFFLMMN